MSVKFPRPTGGGPTTPKPPLQYKCLLCGVVANDQTDLNNHILRAHPILEEEPKEKKVREPSHTKELEAKIEDLTLKLQKTHDSLIKSQAIFEQLVTMHCFWPYTNAKGVLVNRTTGPRIKALLEEMREVLK
jgi:uncharacterized C2H2 Zn-finger protein